MVFEYSGCCRAKLREVGISQNNAPARWVGWKVGFCRIQKRIPEKFLVGKMVSACSGDESSDLDFSSQRAEISEEVGFDTRTNTKGN